MFRRKLQVSIAIVAYRSVLKIAREGTSLDKHIDISTTMASPQKRCIYRELPNRATYLSGASQTSNHLVGSQRATINTPE